MLRPILTTVLLAAAFGAACGEGTPTTPTPTPDPISVSETFSDVLNPNGGRTHPFIAERAGAVTATLNLLTINGVAPDTAIVLGLSLGTWNGLACQVILANDNAQVGPTGTLTGSATSNGAFCVRIYDTGRLTQNVEYTVTVTHF